MFSKMKLGTKIISALMLLVAIGVGIGIAGFVGISTVSNGLVQVADVNLPSIQSLQVINEAQTAIDGAENALLSRNITNEERKGFMNKFIDIKKRADDARKIYEPLPQLPKEAVLWKQFVPAWDKWWNDHMEFERIAKIYALTPNDENYAKLSTQALAINPVSFTVAEKLLGEIIEINIKGSEVVKHEAESSAAFLKILLIVIIVIGAAISIIIGFILSRSVNNIIKGMMTQVSTITQAAVDGKLSTRANTTEINFEFRPIGEGVNNILDAVIGPLNVAAEYVDRISKGEIPQKISDSYNGDFNEIKNNLNNCIDAVNYLVADANMLSVAAVEGKLATRADATKHNGDFKKIVSGVNDTLDAVIGPLNVAAEYVDRIAKGDIPKKITDNYNGDFNEIKNNLNMCIDAVNLLVTDANMLSVAAVEGKLATRADAGRHQGDFRKIVQGVDDCLDAVIGPLNVAAEYVDRISKGDIPKKITDNYNGDFNEIKNNLNMLIDAMNQVTSIAQEIASGNLMVKADKRSEQDALMITLIKMIEDLTNFAVNVQGSAQQVATGSEQMSSATEQISQTATEQSSNVEEVTSSMEEMNSSVIQNADNARQTTAIAEKAANDAFEGGKAVNETVKAMKSISEKIGIIEAIAAQTNMLALNAAIEAARAGEHGKGFAVVASEVRNLAERSKTAAKEISTLSQSSVEVAERAGNLINDMVPQIKKTSDLIQEINASSNEQATGIEQVTKAIEQLDKSIQQNTSATEEMAGTSVELSSQAEDLMRVAAFFKVDKTDSKYGKKSSGNVSITKSFSDKKEVYAANKKSSNVSSAKVHESSDKKGVSIDLGSSDDSNFERI